MPRRPFTGRSDESQGEGIVPDTVSFCVFPRASLIANYFNDPEKDINLNFCRERKITVFRTIASGGPIFGDTGYIFTFLHLARDNRRSRQCRKDVRKDAHRNRRWNFGIF